MEAGCLLDMIFQTLQKVIIKRHYLVTSLTNPVTQIVGYIMSGDPTYITSFNGARSLIMKVERDELVEELLKAYIEHNAWE